MRIVKAHAYGNDFLYTSFDDAEASGVAPDQLGRRLCARHTGVGADGLILYRETAEGATMRLVNADGSPSEVSGNGVRGLGAILARSRHLAVGDELSIATAAGTKRLVLYAREGKARFRFRAEMGRPERLRQVALDVAGERIEVGALSVGNPQCVLLSSLDEARLVRLGPALQRHPEFPDGVNFEIAHVEAADRVRILIWERGVGLTESSGTGSCAAAIVAAVFGGAARDVEVIAPGGSQRVAWTDEGIHLTGWAEVLFEGRWVT